jgi:hypothetical protein
MAVAHCGRNGEASAGSEANSTLGAALATNVPCAPIKVQTAWVALLARSGRSGSADDEARARELEESSTAGGGGGRRRKEETKGGDERRRRKEETKGEDGGGGGGGGSRRRKTCNPATPYDARGQVPSSIRRGQSGSETVRRGAGQFSQVSLENLLPRSATFPSPSALIPAGQYLGKCNLRALLHAF